MVGVVDVHIKKNFNVIFNYLLPKSSGRCRWPSAAYPWGHLVVELLISLRRNCHINESRLRLSAYNKRPSIAYPWVVRLGMLMGPTVQL